MPKIRFKDHPEFRPNLTPKQMLQMGSFGGTYFRDIYSSVTNKNYKNVWKELPPDWIKGLDIDTQVASQICRPKINKYGVKSGTSLDYWEQQGWMNKADPYGWFQWYCRFYQGRRIKDDERQIDRFNKFAGPNGRWKLNLCKKITNKTSSIKKGVADFTISPVVRQGLQQWAYVLTEEDLRNYKKKQKQKQKT